MRILFCLLAAVCSAFAAARPSVFPPPQEMTLSGQRFAVDGSTAIVVPAGAPAGDLALAKTLANDLNDRFGLTLSIRRASALPASGKAIVMGTFGSPLVKAYCARKGIAVTAASPGPSGYVLRAAPDVALVAGSDDLGAFYGMQSLRQLFTRAAGGGVELTEAQIRDWPAKPFRGMKVYLPGRTNIPFFKRFVRDFLALYKFNKVIVEMNACMRLDRHPELNAGWVEFARDTNYSRRNYPPGPPHGLEQNSSHQDTADGGYLEKSEVADLVRWAEANHVEMIPEIPSLTHSYYLMTRHKDLSDLDGEKWPDTFCPSNPKSYELLFDVFDEYIEVMHPKMIHIGHDEWFAPVGLCPRCQGKDPGDLYAADLTKTRDYLAKKGVRMAMWGDMLLESVRGKGTRKRKTREGWAYNAPGALTPAQVKLVPKDILVFNWFWSGSPARSAPREAQLEEFGFQAIWGNFTPGIQDYETRAKRKTIIGGAPSSWAATNEFNIGKDQVYDMLGVENLLWSGKPMPPKELARAVQSVLPEVRERFRGELAPSGYGDPVAPVDISASYNTGVAGAPPAPGGFDLPPDGAVVVGAEGKEKNPLPREATVKIGQDATSLIFLHACAKPATNKEAYRVIWDMEDTADMLGFYEVVYEDGFTLTIPIRYGVNILEWNWERNPKTQKVCYGADPVTTGDPQAPVTFYAYEWASPRLGKVIREVRLKGTTGFRGGVQGFEDRFGDVIPNNAVLLKGISVVKAR